MILILCSPSDVPALWAYQGLQAAGLASVVLLTSDRLALSTDWDHRIGEAGASVSFKLPDGRQVSDREIEGVLNRLMVPPQELLSYTAPADRDYAMQEMMAFYLSWLAALSVPVLNRPTPQGLAGRWFHGSELVQLAEQAGLSAPAWRQSASDPADLGYRSLAPTGTMTTQIIVLDGEVFGPSLPAGIREGCVALAGLAETRLLGIDFYASRDDLWTFAHATPMPAFQIGGSAFVAHLAFIFRAGQYR